MDIRVKYLTRFNNAPVMSYLDDEGMLKGQIISKDVVSHMAMGQMLDIDEAVFEEGTEYGIDISILMEDFAISPDDIQEALRKHNIWTLQDYYTDRKAVFAAMQSITSRILRQLDAAMNMLKSGE